MKNLIKTLCLSVVLLLTLSANAARNKPKFLVPKFFGGELEYIMIDSLHRASFTPTLLVEMQKEGKHVGYALFITGYRDNSWSYAGQYSIEIHTDKRSGNGAVYYLGSTKEQAINTLNSLVMIAEDKVHDNMMNHSVWSTFSKKSAFFKHYYSLAPSDPMQLYTIRRYETGMSKASAGVYISNEYMEPAFVAKKSLETFAKDIENYQETAEPISSEEWEKENYIAGLPLEEIQSVHFSNPICGYLVEASGWKGFGGSEMYVVRNEYIPNESDTYGIFPQEAGAEHMLSFGKYCIYDPLTAQGGMVNIGNSIEQAIGTIDELLLAIEKHKKFIDEHKIWGFSREKMPEGFVYMWDIPEEYVLEGSIMTYPTSTVPVYIGMTNMGIDWKGLNTNATVLKKVRKILVKEQERLAKEKTGK